MIGAATAAVRRLVGADRAKPAASPLLPQIDREALELPIAEARERSEAANREHEASTARVAEVAEQIRDAEAAFDAEGTDELADRIVQLKREHERRQLFSQRTQRAAVTAAGAVEQAVAARNAAVLAHLNDRVTSAADRLRQLWERKGHRATLLLAEFMEEADAIITDAQTANSEARSMTRGDRTEASARAMGRSPSRCAVELGQRRRQPSDAAQARKALRLMDHTGTGPTTSPAKRCRGSQVCFPSSACGLAELTRGPALRMHRVLRARSRGALSFLPASLRDERG